MNICFWTIELTIHSDAIIGLHCVSEKTSPFLFFLLTLLSPAHTGENGDCRRIRRQIVAKFGDYSRQCGQGFRYRRNGWYCMPVKNRYQLHKVQ